MNANRSPFAVLVVIAVAAASATAQTTVQAAAPAGRPCPSCDSTRAAEERARSRLVAQLVQHQAQFAELRAALNHLVERGAAERERRELETLIAATQRSMSEAERRLQEACDGPADPIGSIGALFIADTLAHKARYPVVYSVTPGSPAARAGLTPADTVVRINGRDVREQPMHVFFRPGTTLSITLKRGGGPETVTVSVGPAVRLFSGPCGGFVERRVLVRGKSDSATGRASGRGRGAVMTGPIGARPAQGTEARVTVGQRLDLSDGVIAFNQNMAIAGADLVMLNQGLRAALQLSPSDTGVLVLGAPAGTPAARSGLRSGDVIIEASGRPVTEIGVVMRAVMEARSRTVDLDVLRVVSAQPGVDARGQRRERVTVTLRW